jgi:beta-galactosidase
MTTCTFNVKNASRFQILLLICIVLTCCQKPKDDEARTRVKFNTDWKFINEDVEDGQDPDFDDSAWRQLNLPHDWAIEGPFSEEVYFQGGFLPYPGIGWYRKTFDIAAEGKIVLLEFDGIMMNAKVWLNGEYVGEWAFGYSSFALDITKSIKHNQKNVLAIRVENTDYSSRWYPGSGIYRNVWLTVTNPIHVAHWGTYITTPDISDKEAMVQVETWISNKSEYDQEILLETSINDASGKEIVKNIKQDQVSKSDDLKFQQNIRLPDPDRWDIANPYLYSVISRVIVNEKVFDEYETPFGIRTFKFEADKGFSLNGRSVKINGVNMHHDLGPLGTAVSYRATERQLEILKDMGVNSIRTAHNPPSPEQLDLCDKMGILVMDESFDEWRKPKHNVKNSYSSLFDEWAEKDMRALIKRDRNHPSIILWSTGNEVPELGTPDGKKSAKMLADICRELDPTRPVSSGIHLSIKIDQELMDIFDVAGFNYWHEKLEELHQAFPDKPILVTEAAAVLSSRGEYHFPVKRVYSGWQHESKHISSYDLTNTGFGALPDVEFQLQDDFEWLAGQFVWSGFDYHGEPDPYEDAWPAHSSYFGIIDMCGFPKDRYYLYQSQWSEKPMVHLLPHWNWEGREGQTIPIFVYTNGASAELFVNGKSKGKKVKDKGQYRLKWNDVIYQPGSIKAVAYDANDNILVEKAIRTADKPYQIELIPDRQKINADGEDLSFITVRIKDKNDIFCPKAGKLISFKVEGEGTIAAVGNGDPTSLESYQANKRKVFNGLCLLVIRSTDKAGKIQITATSPGLQEKKIDLLTRYDK